MEVKHPHCDGLVLHAPGECKFCDMCPDRQMVRKTRKILFTGEAPRSGWLPCPSESRRPVSIINEWPGNRPAQKEETMTDCKCDQVQNMAMTPVVKPVTSYERTYATLIEALQRLQDASYNMGAFGECDWHAYAEIASIEKPLVSLIRTLEAQIHWDQLETDGRRAEMDEED